MELTWTAALQREAPRAAAQTLRCVWVSLINGGYVPFLQHMVANLRAVGMGDLPLVVACSDDAALRASLALGVTTVDVRPGGPSPLLGPDDGGDSTAIRAAQQHARHLTTWASHDYKRMVFAKLDALLAAVRAAAECGVEWVGYLDFDIAVLRDFRADLARVAQEHPHVHALTQCDEGANSVSGAHTCSSPRRCGYMCSGFMLLRVAAAAPRAVRWFTYSSADMASHSSDQTLLAARWAADGTPRASLDRAVYLNGAAAGVNVSTTQRALPPHAALVHFNYLVGADKFARMRSWRLWRGP